MPTIVIRYSTAESENSTKLREELAEGLAHALPDMIVQALLPTQEITAKQMTIDIQPYHRLAYNVASLCVEVQLSPGEYGKAYEMRKLIRTALRRSVVGWLRDPELVTRVAAGHVRDVDINLVFASLCGVNFDAASGQDKSAWGGPKN